MAPAPAISAPAPPLSARALPPVASPPASAPGTLPPRPGSGGYRFPSGQERLRIWARNALGPGAAVGNLASAAWGEWGTEEPAEWPGGGRGLALRMGAESVSTALTQTSLALLLEATRQDARYYRCPRAGFGPRLAHALEMTVVARRPDGSAVFSLGKTVSPFVGPLATRNTLYPARYNAADGALSGAFALLTNAGWNLLREFLLPAPEW